MPRTEVGRTEVVWDNNNPDFVKQFQVDYLFEQVQFFVIEAYDCDDEENATDLRKQDMIGQVTFNLE